MRVSEWKCTYCGQWVSMTYSKHVHAITPESVTLTDMIQARTQGIDATEPSYVTEQWTPEHERRTREETAE